MAEGLSEATANAVLSAIFQGVSYAAGGRWVQLHVGAPGAAGTSNIASNSTRMNAAACFATSPSGGAISNSADIGPWLAVPASETYTHISIWSASTSGTFVGSGTITTAAVTAGDDFPIPAGDVSAAFALAS